VSCSSTTCCPTLCPSLMTHFSKSTMAAIPWPMASLSPPFSHFYEITCPSDTHRIRWISKRSRMSAKMLRIIVLLASCSVARAFVQPSLHVTVTRRSSRLPSSIPSNLESSESASISVPPPSTAQQSSSSAPRISEVDVLYGSRTSLIYDPILERYVPTDTPHDDDNDVLASSTAESSSNFIVRKFRRSILPRLRHSFLPEGVYPSYYRFIRWRIIQRFVNANVHVFGTQSLLMGLGLKTNNLGLSAALNWVLKDALGKIVRMGWASKMGRKFDSDAKRWRFRSSLVFALGNALEIITYVFPSLFLLWATCANCCKQISMLTSSSTRTAIYNSFRDGKRENIGDITAKGEAQIAVVDLLGIASGVTLSKMVGMSVKSVLSVYLILQAIELFCLYHEIRAVEFRVLNFERLVQLVVAFTDDEPLPTPQEMAKTEKIFLPPKHLKRRAIAFGSMGRAKMNPNELSELLGIFQKERFLLVVGPNVKNSNRRRLFLSSQMYPPPEEQCHIVLHTDATNIDIVKSTLALSLLRKALASPDYQDMDLRSSDCMELVENCYLEADRMFPSFLKSMQVAGWAPPARFMFGRVTMRAEWPLQIASKQRDLNTTAIISSANASTTST